MVRRHTLELEDRCVQNFDNSVEYQASHHNVSLCAHIMASHQETIGPVKQNISA